jgi:hypothetical protein
MKEPLRYSVVNLERGTVNHVTDCRGMQELPARPQSLACDFCNRQADRLWCRQVRPVGVEIVPKMRLVHTGGPWNACVFCNPLVQDRDAVALVARAQIVNPPVACMPPQYLARLYDALFDATDGPPVEWAAGDVFPVHT